jgi:NAD(P)-dependent dehydrogenase (short-subunit alcohol dehydrogenase family)
VSALRFDGQVAIVTGAGGSFNLGRAHVHLLAQRGAKVVVNDLGIGPGNKGTDPASAEAVAAEVNAAGGVAIANLGSVAEENSAHAIIQAALDQWGRIDILINNAGIGLVADIDEISSRDIGRILDVHLMGAIWMCRAAWPHMRKAGYGRIVNTTSGAMFGMQGTSIYAAAKFGIYGLTRGLAVEGAAHNIKVNALSPGAATNSMGHGLVLTDPVMNENYKKAYPPELVSSAVAYLAHETCAVTGALLQAGGGNVSARLISATSGYTKPGLTLEDVAENVRVIFDDAGATLATDPYSATGGGNDALAGLMVRTPYEPS